MAKRPKGIRPDEQIRNLPTSQLTLDERLYIVESDLDAFMDGASDEEDRRQILAAKRKLKKISRMDNMTKEENLNAIDAQMWQWRHGGVEVSSATMSEYTEYRARVENAHRIGAGIATAALVTGINSYFGSLSESTGQGIKERKAKKAVSLAQKGISIATAAYFLGPTAAVATVAYQAISWGAGEYAAQVKLNRANNDAAYRASLLGPASYSGSR